MAENNWSVNPRTGQVNPSTIVDEVKTVALDSAANAYGFRLDYVPYEVLATPIDIVENVTGGAAWLEVDGAPSAGQYYVDYDQVGRFGTGFVEFNAADNGKSFLVTYRGIGRCVRLDELASQVSSETNTEDALPSTFYQVWSATGTIANGDLSASITHGIANLMTGNRAIAVIPALFNASTIAAAGVVNTMGTSGIGGQTIAAVNYDDTTVTITRGATSSPRKFRITIFYTAE